MANPGICDCGNYGGGRHTKSARCPESIAELRARIADLEAALLTTNANNAEYCKRHVAHVESVRQLEKNLAHWRQAHRVAATENQRLRADAERLDWAQANQQYFHSLIQETANGIHVSLRSAIDAVSKP
jgi:chromosome segregation ATPase